MGGHFSSSRVLFSHHNYEGQVENVNKHPSANNMQVAKWLGWIQLTFVCLKSKIGTLEQCVKYVQS